MNLDQIRDKHLRLRRDKHLDKARQGILAFTTYTKTDYEINWHHKLTCQYINRFIAGEIRFLMIFEPPRHGKSEITSRKLPAFIHGKFPDAEIMAGSYSGSLADDMTADVQRVIDSPEYAQVFPNTKIVPPGQKMPPYVRNSQEYDVIGRRGKYRGQGVGGSFTGKGGRFILIDDPIKGRENADSPTFREKLWKWYVSDLRSRLSKGGQILIIQTRWHEDDLAGRILRLGESDPSADQFTVLNLPAIKETNDNLEDPRAIGDALWPSQYSIKDLKAIEAADSRGFTALYQQRPTALEGGIIKASWLQFYKKKDLPKTFDRIVMSFDFNFKEGNTNDPICGQVWGVSGRKKYLIDQVREKIGFADSLGWVSILSARWPLARRKLMEEKANGAAIIETARRKGITGIIAVNPKESKEARLHACSTDFEAGDVWYPHPDEQPWIKINVNEILNFPNDVHDDTVDATSQFLNDDGRNISSGPLIMAL